jgi:hypothetical protein
VQAHETLAPGTHSFELGAEVDPPIDAAVDIVLDVPPVPLTGAANVASEQLPPAAALSVVSPVPSLHPTATNAANAKNRVSICRIS